MKPLIEKTKFYSVTPEKLVCMSVVTFGFYCWYWIFQNWKSVRRLGKIEYSPLIRTWLFVLFNSQLFESIKDSAKLQNIEVTWSSVKVSIIFNLILLGWFFPYTLFLSIFIGTCLLPINLTCQKLNDVQGFDVISEGFNKTDWKVIIVGGIFVVHAILNQVGHFLRDAGQ